MTRPPTLLITALFVGSIAALGARTEGPSTQPPVICTIHEEMESFTMDWISLQLDSLAGDPDVAPFLDSIGLTGVPSSSATVVRDSAKCASARTAYASLYFGPADTIRRNGFLANVPGIFVVRLAPNRYLVNAGMEDLWRPHHMLVLDSTWSLVANHF